MGPPQLLITLEFINKRQRASAERQVSRYTQGQPVLETVTGTGC